MMNDIKVVIPDTYPLSRGGSADNQYGEKGTDSKHRTDVEPLLWERFIGAEVPSRFPCCGWICTLVMVLLCTLAGGNFLKLSNSSGFFVLSEKLTQAFFAHQEMLKGATYFTDFAEGHSPERITNREFAVQRSIPVRLATIFIEAKGTKCPGVECDLKSKNVITAKYLGYMKAVEEKIWNDEVFQNEYCALLRPFASSMCYPPYSPLSLMLWGDGVGPTAASKKLNIQERLGMDTDNCRAWQSPVSGSKCSSPAWSHVIPDSGAAAPGNLENYSKVIDTFCRRFNPKTHLREAFLPNFACTQSHMKEYGVPFMRSHLLFGLPYDGHQKMNHKRSREQLSDLEDDYGEAFFNLFSKVVTDVVDGDESVNIVVDSPISHKLQERQLQIRSMPLVALSFLLVFFYMWFNVESCFLACFGMLQIICSLFPTLLVWHAINQQGVQFLQVLALFLVLGIGADDIFVLNDAWKQAKHELAEVGCTSNLQIFTVAYRRSFDALLATTMTSAFAFFVGVLNPIPAIADFCIFSCVIIIVVFLFNVSIFAASIAFQDRFMAEHTMCCCGPQPAPGTCCAPGCCWGSARIAWRRCRGIPAEETTEERSLEVFFSGPFLTFVKGFKYPLIIFWMLLLVAAISSAVLGVRITEKDPQRYVDDHPLQRFTTITSEYFTQPEPEKVQVVWGFAEKGAVSKWSSTTGQMPAKIEFMNVSAALSKEGQQKILNLCRAPDDRAGTLRCRKKSCLVKGSERKCFRESLNGIGYNNAPLCQSGRWCIMEQVKEYADRKSLPFPLEDFDGVVSSSDFQQYLLEWSDVMHEKKQHWYADSYEENTGFVLEDSKVKYMWITFNATFEGHFLSAKEATEIHNRWEAFVNLHADGTKYQQVSIMYLFKVLQDMLVREAFKIIGMSLAIVFVTLSLVTWNWAIALLGLLNICCILCYFLGLWPLLGWELDIHNLIFCIVAVGLSVGYMVHLLHAYNASGEELREGRVKVALSEMGITVLNGAVTTLMAAVPLFFSIFTFHQRFGLFIFICILLSILTSVLLLVPLLLVLGPTGQHGNIHAFYWLRARCCSRQVKQERTHGKTQPPILLGRPESMGTENKPQDKIEVPGSEKKTEEKMERDTEVVGDLEP